ncbi:Asp-tRNA(Asn)/Glu-tRNA(Gln) amidotransferase subunit GatC [bacterium]|nr:Asp-tRNA(Asn)/Glu-tRNA(Gln) amidotransferase subunit GatC [bacterium]
MSLKRENLQNLAKLAHLTIPKHDEERILSDLSTIVSFFEALQDIDTDNVKPLLTPLDKAGVFFDDLPEPDQNASRFLANSPDQASSLYRFPSVMPNHEKGE